MDSYFDCVQKILSTDSRFHHLWSICLIQLIRWIHLILKPQECIPVGCVPAERWPYSGGEPPPQKRPPPKIWRYPFSPKKDTPPENLEVPLQKKTPPQNLEVPPQKRHPQKKTPPKKTPPGTRHPPLWTEWMTDACENITLAKTSFRPVKIGKTRMMDVKMII